MPADHHLSSASMRQIAPAKAYRLMEAGPIVLVTTARAGVHNVMTMGFHMVLQHNPPLIACVIGPWDYSFEAVAETRECVIAIPGADLVEKVVAIGNCSGSEVDKFARFNLERAKPQLVSAPLLAECPWNLECRVHDMTLIERYNLFVLEVVSISVNENVPDKRMLHHHGDGTFTADGERIDLRERMTLWKQFQVDL